MVAARVSEKPQNHELKEPLSPDPQFVPWQVARRSALTAPGLSGVNKIVSGLNNRIGKVLPLHVLLDRRNALQPERDVPRYIK